MLPSAQVSARRGGRYVVFVYSGRPDTQEHVEAEILPRLPEHAAILNWSEREHWPFWSIPVWLFKLLGGRHEFDWIGIVARWGWPRVFRDERAFLEAAGPGPAVELCDEGPNSASLSWTGPRARAVALAILVELARRLEGEDDVARLRLDGDVGEPIDVGTIDEFVAAAPAVLVRLYSGFTFTFRLNEGTREYRLGHLDQSLPGMWFQAPEQNETFWDTLGEVLRDFAARSRYVRVSGGPWYEDTAPFR